LNKCILAKYNYAVRHLYQFLTLCSVPVFKVLGVFNNKIRKGVKGRQCTFEKLTQSLNPTLKTFWFHCASLGEYEQGLPVFEILKNKFPDHQIVLSFFSPSGYEIRRNAAIADVVVYMPLDTKSNAERFLDLVNPSLTIFVKYEIWPHFLETLYKHHFKVILISALFRKNQVFFKSYGVWMQDYLRMFNHIFVQNEGSKTLLNSININEVTVAGDTRLDRVYKQLEHDNKLDFIADFVGDSICVVAGSTWPEGDQYLADFINNSTHKKVKYIIAPHDISKNRINSITKKFHVNTVLFSDFERSTLAQATVFVIDTIGLLSKIYSYADIAYVGGAVGNTGLHNIWEPAVFGVPIIIGSNHQKYPEALILKEHGGLFDVMSASDFNKTLNELLISSELRIKSGQTNSSYIQKNKGALMKIIKYIDEKLRI
jgi:3-deoxy-D-manno-octulosonic-acid transferase